MYKVVGNLLLLAVIAVVGCGQPSAPLAPTGAPAESSKFRLQAEPDGAQTVITVRETAKDNEDVVIVGRIGGSENPWIQDLAAFTIVDPSLKACSDIPGDDCPVPWDYCCETAKLPTAKALVQFVEPNGSVVNLDARKLLNVKELQTVVILGKAKRDDAGNLTVLANGIFVRE